MTTIHVKARNSWRTAFVSVEKNIFRIKPGEWSSAQEMKLKDLAAKRRLNYNQKIHQIHVELLNNNLQLAIPLKPSDFTGNTILGDLMEVIIRPRVKSSIQLRLPDGVTALSDIGLDHIA